MGANFWHSFSFSPTPTDLQTINLVLRVLFRPDEAKLGQIFRNLGLDYDERVLPSLGNEVLKAVVVSKEAGVKTYNKNC